jgi:hypothetical protein
LLTNQKLSSKLEEILYNSLLAIHLFHSSKQAFFLSQISLCPAQGENFPSPRSIRKSVKNRGREQKLSPRVSSFVSLPFYALVAVCVCVFGLCKERKEKAKETKKKKK